MQLIDKIWNHISSNYSVVCIINVQNYSQSLQLKFKHYYGIMTEGY